MMQNALVWWRTVASLAAEFVYPHQCCLCGLVGRPDVCPECLEECVERTDPPGFRTGPYTWTDAPYSYEGRPAQAVRRLKYDRATGLVAWMAGELLRRHTEAEASTSFDVVVPVPLARGRLAERGFNQSELLASQLPDLHLDLLKRTRETRPQVSLDAGERRANLSGAFWASPQVQGLRVLLVDDVVTTGATAEACGIALAAAGAVLVGILTFCRVDDPIGPA